MSMCVYENNIRFENYVYRAVRMTFLPSHELKQGVETSSMVVKSSYLQSVELRDLFNSSVISFSDIANSVKW